MNATVRYDVGTYGGQLTVAYDEGDDDATIIARAKAQLRRRCPGGSYYPSGTCYEAWQVLSRGGQP